MTRKLKIFSLALLLLALALPATAQDDAQALEQFRSEMLSYVGSIGRLPASLRARGNADADSLGRADQAIRNMSYDDLRVLRAQMDTVPMWREVPSILASMTESSTAPSPRELALTLAPMNGPYNPEMVRKPLLAMIEAFKQVPAEMVHPDYRQHVANLEQIITGATAADLIVLNDAIRPNLGQWNERLAQARDGRLPDSALKLAPNNHCSGGFPSNAICELNHIINDIAAFFQALPGYATSAFDSIKNIFTSAVGALPTTFQGVVNRLGLSSVNWNQVATTALDYARLPCPPENFLLPGFGRVGEIRTWTNYSGTIGFAGNAITELTPSDILTSADLQAIMIVINFPIQWLSRCLEESWNDNYETAQENHRTHVETNLDVVASTRATQTSVNTAQAQTNDLDADVVKVEAKLDRLGAASDRIEATTLSTIVTSDRLETTSVRLDTTATRLEGKVDNLQLQQGQTNDILTSLRTAYLRMLIENDLTRQAHTRISMFELPQQFGGLLETAKAIVEETLTRRAAAGVDVRRASEEFAAGNSELANGNFKSAYTHYRTAYQRAVN